MQRMVAQNKEKYAAELADFDDLDSPEDESASASSARTGRRTSCDGRRQTSTTADITSKIEELRARTLGFSGPEYSYMSRALRLLEGIGLSIDENYAILKECFPYLAKRLLSDDRRAARCGRCSTAPAARSSSLTSCGTSPTASRATPLRRCPSSGGRVHAHGRRAPPDRRRGSAREASFVQDLILREAAADGRQGPDALSTPSPRPRLPPSTQPRAPAPAPAELLRAAVEAGVSTHRTTRLETLDIIASLLPAPGRPTGASRPSRSPPSRPPLPPPRRRLPSGRVHEPIAAESAVLQARRDAPGPRPPEAASRAPAPSAARRGPTTTPSTTEPACCVPSCARRVPDGDKHSAVERHIARRLGRARPRPATSGHQEPPRCGNSPS